VGGTPIYKTMMGNALHSLAPDTPEARGIRTLLDVRMFHLDVQQRTLHAGHSANIQQMSSMDIKREHITSVLLACYPEITAEDLDRDSLWRDAPIAVPNNALRLRIIASCLLEHAKREGLPILFWDNILHGKNAQCLTAAETANLHHTHSDLRSYFVAGTPSFLLDNISTEKGIVNGAPCVTHSLSLHPEEAQERERQNAEATVRQQARQQRRIAAAEARAAAGDAAEPEEAADACGDDTLLSWPPLEQALLNAKPGELIQLALPRLSINVRLQEQHFSRFSPDDTLLKDIALVPVPISRYPRYSNIEPWELLNKARSPIASVGYHSHGVEPSFAITYHKVLPACPLLSSRVLTPVLCPCRSRGKPSLGSYLISITILTDA
jgi:hypothetical protein